MQNLVERQKDYRTFREWSGVLAKIIIILTKDDDSSHCPALFKQAKPNNGKMGTEVQVIIYLKSLILLTDLNIKAD